MFVDDMRKVVYQIHTHQGRDAVDLKDTVYSQALYGVEQRYPECEFVLEEVDVKESNVLYSGGVEYTFRFLARKKSASFLAAEERIKKLEYMLNNCVCGYRRGL